MIIFMLDYAFDANTINRNYQYWHPYNEITENKICEKHYFLTSLAMLLQTGEQQQDGAVKDKGL
ncbi:hypothetical protein T07_6714 [Trichinella nelsoni]|uniref:Uncharacterized protein n=1 Tax=Trichinella nelsoni TaxID=6336 RepID=A0A0V0RE33_9BILA|nr:hypothetical protein T07_6714 [Trichinella nelsoni]